MRRRRPPDPLQELRAEWKAWKRADFRVLSHIDYCLAPCAERCGWCEGCASAAYRAERMAEIEQKAAALGGQVRPEPKRKAKPEQLTFEVTEIAPGVYEDVRRWSR
jgi:hypothetical protein